MSERFVENQVAVIGGEGGMGRVTIELFQSIGYQTLSQDIKNPSSPSPQEAIAQSRIVFFSVLPIEEIETIVDKSLDQFTPEHVVLDNATLKKPLAETYRKLNEIGVSICSTHPLCKHDQPLHGQKALSLPVGNNSQQASDIAEKLYKSAGMQIINMQFAEHDKNMRMVQFVPHKVMRAVAETFRKLDVDMNKLQEIAPANFQLFNLSLWRTEVQDPRISATIIANLGIDPEGIEISDAFEASFREISATRSTDSLTEKFKSTYDALNQDNLGSKMNEKTIVVLERLANLDAKSMSVKVSEDRAGLLRELLLPFENVGISLTAIDSHKSKGDLEFELGIDEETATPEAIAATVSALTQSGCEVTHIPNGNLK